MLPSIHNVTHLLLKCDTFRTSCIILLIGENNWLICLSSFYLNENWRLKLLGNYYCEFHTLIDIFQILNDQFKTKTRDNSQLSITTANSKCYANYITRCHARAIIFCHLETCSQILHSFIITKHNLLFYIM